MSFRTNARVCFISTLSELGGAEVCLLDTMELIQERHPEWQVCLIAPGEGALAARARELRIRTEIIPLPPALSRLGDSQFGRHGSVDVLRFGWKTLSAIPAFAGHQFALRRFLRATAPDIIYANGFKAEIAAAISKPRASKLVWHTHDYVSSRRIVVRLFRHFSRYCSAIVANSNSVAEDIRSVVRPEVKSRIQVVYNATNPTYFSREGAQLDLDRLSGLEPAPFGTIRVGFMATMAWWKGHRTYLEAVSRLRNLPIRGYVIGGPIYRTAGSESFLPELRAQAQALGIGDRVGFTGFLQDAGAAIRSVDLLVHASTRPEPFGRVLIEAMACAKPVITTGLGGAAEIVAAGPGTIQFWPGEADDLAKAISTLATDASLRKQLGESAYITACRHFGRERLAQTLDRLFTSLLPAPAPMVINSGFALEDKALVSGL